MDQRLQKVAEAVAALTPTEAEIVGKRLGELMDGGHFLDVMNAFVEAADKALEIKESSNGR